ncbi:MAG: ATP-dependent Clp protease ATP-binding subunit [Hamadaea sp.]|uniref:Clp protease N-terminal domain-containing protein n=1 Tax=Hamadaea sp. TaxID=2024425 RepID=UPI0017B43981|nr:Clp protease N-terminal domain-containing protein [Hamadaea sp.]NUR71934.1 ATP-dependent Clp protease ATP-binding subunit [Hamadaea sp.]NUT18237.1 ATP-dependent Clp protease ATP-binding subunit [Hamadaea sp.]
MPKINVYLSDELADAVKQTNLPVSAICQRALEQAVRRVTAMHESLHDEVSLEANVQFSRFTKRAQSIVSLAVEDARADNRPASTADLLAAIVDEKENLAVRILRSMEIEPEDLTAALAARHAQPTESSGQRYEDSLKEALRLAVTEAMSLGHNYVGSEHLLLGLIAEPAGSAGHQLRSAGADLRLTRRAVTAVLAGWAARNETAAQPMADVVTALTSAVREQLIPITERLDRLEQRMS